MTPIKFMAVISYDMFINKHVWKKTELFVRQLVIKNCPKLLQTADHSHFFAVQAQLARKAAIAGGDISKGGERGVAFSTYRRASLLLKRQRTQG